MNKHSESSAAEAATTGAAPCEGRRNFLAKAAAVTCGSLAMFAPVAAGVVVVLDPLNRSGAQATRVRVVALDALPADGVPRIFPVVVAHRDDAWTRYHHEPIGSVFLRREKGSDTVECFNASCPHAGCFVDFNTARREYQCPCHTSAFSIDGTSLYGPSPRGLDSLVCSIETVDGVRSVVVDFQDFYTGIAEKMPKA